MNRLRRWYRTARRNLGLEPRRRERCEACGAQTKRPHEITETLTDFDEPGFHVQIGAGSSITATFCPAHCPGNCDHEESHAPAA